jgi:hypothetical protein
MNLIFPSDPDEYCSAQLSVSGVDGWVAPVEDLLKSPVQKKITLGLPVVTHGVLIIFVATVRKDDFEEGNGCPVFWLLWGAGERCDWFTDSPSVEAVTFSQRVSS